MERLGPILIVEDEPALCEFLAILLGSSYEVECARSAEGALEVMAHLRPILVLCDISLPRMRGTDLTVRLRQNSDTASIPVVLISGSQEEGEEQARAAGAVAFLAKPFQISQVMAVVSNFASTPQEPPIQAAH